MVSPITGFDYGQIPGAQARQLRDAQRIREYIEWMKAGGGFQGLSGAGGRLFGPEGREAVQYAMGEADRPSEPLLGWDRENILGSMLDLVNPMAKIGGIAGIMAGPKAATANPVARNLAEEMIRQGRSPEDIWRATGAWYGQPWWLGHPDQVPRFEISDEALEYEPNLYGYWSPAVSEGPIEQAVGHKDLFEAYPAMGRMIKGIHYPGSRYDEGMYQRSPEEITIWEKPGSPWGEESHKTMAHELQHAVQRREGMERGGSLEMFAHARDPEREYQRLGGEMDARAVEKRLRMTPEQRVKRPFWLDYDLPIEEMIIRR